MSTPYPLDILT